MIWSRHWPWPLTLTCTVYQNRNDEQSIEEQIWNVLLGTGWHTGWHSGWRSGWRSGCPSQISSSLQQDLTIVEQKEHALQRFCSVLRLGLWTFSGSPQNLTSLNGVNVEVLPRVRDPTRLLIRYSHSYWSHLAQALLDSRHIHFSLFKYMTWYLIDTCMM